MTEIELQLESHAFGGEALGREASGRVVFVPFGLPGERARVEIVESHERWARGRLLELLSPAPTRADPRCRHFGHCGGCHYQTLDYPGQLAVKREIVREQLQRLAGLPDPPVEPTIPSPAEWHFRNRMSFQLAEGGKPGFVASPAPAATAEPGAPLQVFPISECHLPEPPIDELWRRLELGSTPELKRVTLRSDSYGEAMVILHADGPPQVELETDWECSILWEWPQGLALLAGSPYLWMEVLERRFRVSALAFFQVNSPLVAELVRLVLQHAAVQPGELVQDLFAGVGLFSAFLAQAGGRIVAVERNAWACEDFEHNLAAFDQVALYQAEIEQALPALQERAQVVIVDPPRSGLPRAVLDWLGSAPAPRLVYVSCDPATLARDARRLIESGYQLEQATPIDLFPQTYHIETVTSWIH